MKHNYIWGAIDKLSQLAISLLLTKWIAAYFGTELFGAYQFALSTFAVATSLTWLCPAEIFYSRLDKAGRLADSVITTSIVYRFMLSIGIFTCGIVYILTSVEGIERATFTAVLLLSLTYAEPLGIFRLLIETNGRFHATAKIRFFGLLLKACVIFASIHMAAPPAVVVSAALVESIAVSVICLVFYKRMVAPYTFVFAQWDASVLRDMVVEGVKYWPGLVAMTFGLKADRILLANALDASVYGAYAAAMSLFEQFTSVGTSIVAIAAPIYIYRESGERLRRNFLLACVAVVLLGVIGAIMLYLIAPYVVTLVYGPTFSNAVAVLRSALLFAPIIFLELIASTLMIKQRSPGLFSLKWLVAMAVSLTILHSGTSELYGVYGHVSSWLVASLFSVGFMVRYLMCTANATVKH